jgi:hypothetical protein
MKKAIFVLAFALSPSASLHAACHFASPTPIVCSGPTVAAMAYRKYGLNSELIQKPYTQDLLHRAQCGSYSAEGTQKLEIRLLSKRQIPFDDGYETADIVEVRGRDMVAVADRYLVGECDKFVPTALTAPLDH